MEILAFFGKIEMKAGITNTDKARAIRFKKTNVPRETF